MSDGNLKVMIMAGGTGGHVFPALAVARELKNAGHQVVWLGTERGIESRLVPEAKIKLHFLSIQGVRGRGWKGLAKAPFLVMAAIFQAMGVMRRERPNVVLGFGGFASGPGGVAAKLLRVPLVIHEQNAIAGTTNRYLAPVANRVLTAFDKTLSKAKAVGNPVRAELAAIESPAERFAGRDSQPLRLLVLGGSLGAQAINDLVPKALARIDLTQRPQVRHQAGGANAQATEALYQEQGVEARVEPFIEDMASAYRWADWVICRAGALTVSELMTVGLAGLMVPFPHAIDDHQTHNAAILVNADAALAVSQKDLDAEKLSALIQSEFSDRTRLQAMAERGRSLSTPEAARVVAEQCIEVARG